MTGVYLIATGLFYNIQKELRADPQVEDKQGVPDTACIFDY